MTPGVAFIIFPPKGRRKRKQYALYGEFAVSPDMVERVKVAGVAVRGRRCRMSYQTLPRVPYVDADLNALPEKMPALETLQDVTIVAQLANGRTYTLGNAACRGAFMPPGRGLLRVRFEGEHCEEVKLPIEPPPRRKRRRKRKRAKR